MVRWVFVWSTLFLGATAVGCQTTEPGQTGAAVSPEAASLQVVIPANDFATGRPRIPVIFYDGTRQVDTLQAVTMTAFDLSGENPIPVWSGPATGYPESEIPYWTFYPKVDAPGIWGFQAEITLEDGRVTTSNFAIEALADPESPNIGEIPPASENRTAADVELARLTSAQEPEPALYQTTVAALLASDRPAVITFSTPAFCQTAICAPVVDAVEEVYRDYKDEVGFLHLEIYKEFEPLVVADEVNEWGLPSEPWTFVIDSEGRIAARLAGPVSPAELSGILDGVLEEGA